MVSFAGSARPRMKIGNQFASITSLSVNRPMRELRTYDSVLPIISYGLSEVTFSGIAMYTPEVLKAIQKWMYGTPDFPHYSREFMCLHCGSPQSITRTHCAQCGAPRSFLVG